MIEALTIEQMNNLEYLGLKTNDASMYYWMGIKDQLAMKDNNTSFSINVSGKWCLNGKEMCVPAYTFTDIFNKLPKSIVENDIEYHLIMDFIGSRNEIFLEYRPIERTEFHNKVTLGSWLHIEFDSNWINAAYKMLLWCVQNDYVE